MSLAVVQHCIAKTRTEEDASPNDDEQSSEQVALDAMHTRAQTALGLQMAGGRAKVARPRAHPCPHSRDGCWQGPSDRATRRSTVAARAAPLPSQPKPNGALYVKCTRVACLGKQLHASFCTSGCMPCGYREDDRTNQTMR